MTAVPLRLLTFRGHKVSIFAARMYVVLWPCSHCDAYQDQIRDFVQRFYQFVEGVSQHHRNVDELLSKVSGSPIPKVIVKRMNHSTVTRHHSFQLCQRRLLGQPSENIDALPGCTNNHQSRALRSRQCRARAFSNSPPVRALPNIHTPPSFPNQQTQPHALYLL
jgi:hypothetical protein